MQMVITSCNDYNTVNSQLEWPGTEQVSGQTLTHKTISVYTITSCILTELEVNACFQTICTIKLNSQVLYLMILNLRTVLQILQQLLALASPA